MEALITIVVILAIIALIIHFHKRKQVRIDHPKFRQQTEDQETSVREACIRFEYRTFIEREYVY
jgi:FtsZ-interacting cell division protein ZipA